MAASPRIALQEVPVEGLVWSPHSKAEDAGVWCPHRTSSSSRCTLSGRNGGRWTHPSPISALLYIQAIRWKVLLLQGQSSPSVTLPGHPFADSHRACPTSDSSPAKLTVRPTTTHNCPWLCVCLCLFPLLIRRLHVELGSQL